MIEKTSGGEIKLPILVGVYTIYCMDKNIVNTLIEGLAQDLYEFSYALNLDSKLAEQIVIDSYTVFLIKEKSFIEETDLDFSNRKQRIGFKRFLKNGILKEIFNLSSKNFERSYKIDSKFEYEQFGKLSLLQRAIAFLVLAKKSDIDDVQAIFELHRTNIIEILGQVKRVLNQTERETIIHE